MAIPAQYRRQLYIGGRILEDRELNMLQTFYLNAEELGLGSLYRTGATLNVTATISGNTLSLSATNGSLPMLAFVDGRFEPFTAGALTVSAGSTVYLNYEIAIISAGASDATHDPTLVDGNTLTATAEAGQLNITISTTDTSGVALNDSTQLEKNTSPIALFGVVSGVSGLQVTYPDNANAQAVGSSRASGLLKLSGATRNYSGTVNVINDAVTWASGGTFPTDGSWNGIPLFTQAGTIYYVKTVNNLHSLTLAISTFATTNGVAFSISQSTGSGIAVDTLDNRLSDPRDPIPESVYASSIAPIIYTGGTGSDGSPITDPDAVGQGGITTDNIIYTTDQCVLTWYLQYLMTTIVNNLATAEAYTLAHIYPKQERIFLGYFTHGAAVDATTWGPSGSSNKYVSAYDGHQYVQDDVEFYDCHLASTRPPAAITQGQDNMPSISAEVNGGTMNPATAGSILYTTTYVKPDTCTVYSIVAYWNGSNETDTYDGIVEVYVTVKRS